MSILFLLIPMSIVAAAGFLAGFIWAVRSGQYEDTCTPAMRMLTEDSRPNHSREAAPARDNFGRTNNNPGESPKPNQP